MKLNLKICLLSFTLVLLLSGNTGKIVYVDGETGTPPDPKSKARALLIEGGINKPAAQNLTKATVIRRTPTRYNRGAIFELDTDGDMETFEHLVEINGNTLMNSANKFMHDGANIFIMSAPSTGVWLYPANIPQLLANAH